MKHAFSFFSSSSAFGATALLLAGALLASPAPAEARQRQTTVTGAQGKTAQRTVDRDHGDVSSTSTGPNGKTRSRVVERNAEGTSATVTGANGQTSTRTSSPSAASAPAP